MRQRHAARDCDGRPSFGEKASEAVESPGGNAGDRLDPLRSELAEAASPPVDGPARLAGRVCRPQLVLDDHTGEPERKHAFSARRDRDPLVRIGAGLRHARFDLDERAADLRICLSHLAIGEALCDRRVPGAEEIGAKPDHVATVREIERRQLIAPETHRIRAPEYVVREQFDGDRRGRAKPFREFGEELEPAAPARPCQDRELRLCVPRGERIQPGGQICDRIIPAHRSHVAAEPRAGALPGLREPIGVIGDLNGCLPARTQTAMVDRMIRLPFELLRGTDLHDALLAVADNVGLGFHHADREPAAGAAQRTHARLPLRHAGHELLVGNEANELVLGMAAARERRARAGDRGELDEIAAVHHREGHKGYSGGIVMLSNLVVTGQTIVRCVLLLVTVHAEAHGEIDIPLGHGLLRDAAVTRRAFHLCPEVRRVIEPHVRRVRVAIDALPRNVDAGLLIVRYLLDERPIGRNRVVTDHARLHARQPGHRSLGDGLVAVVRAGETLFDVPLVRKRNRLDRRPADVEELARGLRHRRASGRERRRRQLRRIGRSARRQRERRRHHHSPERRAKQID